MRCGSHYWSLGVHPLGTKKWIVAMRLAGPGQPCEYKVLTVQDLERAPDCWAAASQTYDDLTSAEAQKELLEAEEGPDSLGGW
jgi:hypothetical protein